LSFISFFFQPSSLLGGSNEGIFLVLKSCVRKKESGRGGASRRNKTAPNKHCT
jgi:hypothetical protein